MLVLDLKEPVQVVCREYQPLSRKRRRDVVRILPLPYAEISVRTILGYEMETFQVPCLASGDRVDGHLALAYTSGNAAQGAQTGSALNVDVADIVPTIGADIGHIRPVHANEPRLRGCAGSRAGQCHDLRGLGPVLIETFDHDRAGSASTGVVGGIAARLHSNCLGGGRKGVYSTGAPDVLLDARDGLVSAEFEYAPVPVDDTGGHVQGKVVGTNTL